MTFAILKKLFFFLFFKNNLSFAFKGDSRGVYLCSAIVTLILPVRGVHGAYRAFPSGADTGFFVVRILLARNR